MVQTNLEGMMPNEISQSQKDRQYLIPLSQRSQVYRDRKQNDGCQGPEQLDGELTVQWEQFLFGK